MSSAAMASSSVSQEDLENDFEKSSRRTRIRVARGRETRVQQQQQSRYVDGGAAAAALDVEEPVCSDLRTAGDKCLSHACEHDASPKPAARIKDKRPARPSHINKGKQQRDRRKLREKRRSTGVVHMPSTEVGSTGGSTNEEEEDSGSLGQQPGVSAETRLNTRHNELQLTDPPVTSRQQPPLRHKSLSDLEADDEDNQDGDSAGDQQTPALLRSRQLEEENRRLVRALDDRDQRIWALEATLARIRQEKQLLAQENDALIKAMESLNAQ